MLTGKLRSCAKQTVAWDLTAYTDKYVPYLSVSAQETTPAGLFFSDDGARMYIVGPAGDSVDQFSLSPAWDVAAASFVRVSSVSAQETNPTDVFFKPDGTKMYIIGSTGDDVNEYSLGTAWDISTKTFVRVFSVSAKETSPQGLFFSPDGIQMYVTGGSSDSVHQYTLSTAWDISTSVFVRTLSVSARDTAPTGVFFRSDGLRMYVCGNTNDRVYQYNLSSAWDISTATYITFYSVSFAQTGLNGVFFSSDGFKMYIIGTTPANVMMYTLTTAWDITTVVVPSLTSFSAQDSSGLAIFFKPDGTAIYRLGSINTSVYEYSLSVAWNSTTRTYVRSFSVITQSAGPQGLAFKPDGTKMYVIGTTADNVNEYSLSTAWNISTASFVQAFSIAAQEGSATALQFKPDGTVMYVLGLTSDRVYEYTLSTAWDISTASIAATFSVTSQEGSPRALIFKPDGTYMYVAGDTVKVHEYQLTTPWSISTASYSGVNFWYGLSGPTLGGGNSGLAISPDGNNLYIGTSTSMYQFSV